ncbi:MAG: chemotaxis protein CheC [Candidatus Hydrothermarchaeaceae archaeon]
MSAVKQYESTMKNLGLSEAQLDALKEVGNIGAGHASAALEQMINKRVTISVPEAYPMAIEDLINVLKEEDEIVVGIFFKIFGEIEGSILILLGEEDANFLGNSLLFGEDTGDRELTEDKKSALKEIGNILTSSYLTALSNFTGFNLMPSIPYLAHDMAGSVIDTLIIDMSKTVDYALVINTEFILSNTIVRGKNLTFLDKKSYDAILTALGMHNK